MSTPLAGAEILDGVARAYAALSAYSDSGTIEQCFVGNERAHTTTSHFRTHWTAAELFSFQWWQYRWGRLLHQFTATRTNVDTFTWRTANSEDRQSHYLLQEQLTAYGGVSCWVSWLVPFLLLPEWSGGRPWEVLNVTRIYDEVVDDTLCYRLTMHFPRSDELDPESKPPATLWIEQGSKMIRKVVKVNHLSVATCTTTIRYKVTLNDPTTFAALGPICVMEPG